MNGALYQQADSVRNDFSGVMDRAVYDRPQLIRRRKDQLVLIDTDMLNTILQSSVLHVRIEPGDGGGEIYQLEEIPDIFTESQSRGTALQTLAADLLEYAGTYYSQFALYSHAPNRAGHLPYVMRVLALGTPEKVKEMLLCRAGRTSCTRHNSILTI